MKTSATHRLNSRSTGHLTGCPPCLSSLLRVALPSVPLWLKVSSPWSFGTTESWSGSAMVEYSLDLDIPDYVFEHPILMAMSNATTDMMTWPNVRRLKVGFTIVQCYSSSFYSYRTFVPSMYVVLFPWYKCSLNFQSRRNKPMVIFRTWSVALWSSAESNFKRQWIFWSRC